LIPPAQPGAAQDHCGFTAGGYKLRPGFWLASASNPARYFPASCASPVNEVVNKLASKPNLPGLIHGSQRGTPVVSNHQILDVLEKRVTGFESLEQLSG
jgi:hypothetical protein